MQEICFECLLCARYSAKFCLTKISMQRIHTSVRPTVQNLSFKDTYCNKNSLGESDFQTLLSVYPAVTIITENRMQTTDRSFIIFFK